jgi:hypothetical protein
MPDDLLDHLERWRASAQEMLADADIQTDARTRQRMIDIAAGYERLSQEAELMLGRKRASWQKSGRTAR